MNFKKLHILLIISILEVTKLLIYNRRMHNLISRRQYNDRRKITSTLCNNLRKKIASYYVLYRCT
jgi:hypothetical protein